MATGLEKDLSKRTLNTQSNVQNCLTPPLLYLSFERSGDHVWTIISVLYSVSSSCTLQPETLVETVRWHYLTMKMSVSCCRNEPDQSNWEKQDHPHCLTLNDWSGKKNAGKKLLYSNWKFGSILRIHFCNRSTQKGNADGKKNVCILY